MFGRIYVVTVYGEDETTIEKLSFFTSLRRAKKYAKYFYYNEVRVRKLLGVDFKSGCFELLYCKPENSSILMKNEGAIK